MVLARLDPVTSHFPQLGKVFSPGRYGIPSDAIASAIPKAPSACCELTNCRPYRAEAHFYRSAINSGEIRILMWLHTRL